MGYVVPRVLEDLSIAESLVFVIAITRKSLPTNVTPKPNQSRNELVTLNHAHQGGLSVAGAHVPRHVVEENRFVVFIVSTRYKEVTVK